MLDLSLYEQ